MVWPGEISLISVACRARVAQDLLPGESSELHGIQPSCLNLTVGHQRGVAHITNRLAAQEPPHISFDRFTT